MDVPTLNVNMNNKKQLQVTGAVSNAPKKLTIGAIAALGLMLSPLSHADDIGMLIQKKMQSFNKQPFNQSYSQPTFSSQSVAHTSILPEPKYFHMNYAAAPNIDVEHIDTLYAAEQSAPLAGKHVLQTVRQMALDKKEIVKGSCWDYLNAAFNRAGVARDTIFKGQYPHGPFVDTNQIQPGDWLYYVNHNYNDVEHSGLFVGWINRTQNQALILSYAGENRREPARYKVYDVSHTYNIMRPML